MTRSSTNAAPDVPSEDAECLDVQAEQHDSVSSSSDYAYQLAALLLKWKEGRRLPESTVHELANDVIDFVETITDHQQIQPQDEPAINIEEICKQQLDQLRTRSGRTTYWKAHFPLVESRTVVLHGGDTMEYVPLCEVLKCILEHSQLSNECSSYSCADGYMHSIFDGSAFKNHEYFAGDTSKLCLQLYSDEFEVCNPLGSKRGKHKLTGVYFSVLNFDVKLRSALSGQEEKRGITDKCWGVPLAMAGAGFLVGMPWSWFGLLLVFFVEKFGVTREEASWPKSVATTITNISGK
ncbi:hypothetical protein HPB49_023570 [Dermacentor silvarum]|uniref:Uncharacterized protein n=1 Tax=Dermacentor silvarum TaxID=543639 RepID=A0ACB8D8S3_DERSI|nr:hypothetical protein HPB49_023570 [Dermacentor silvarum]